MTTVLVTGGTGHLGRELVPRLTARGTDVRVLSRQRRPDLPEPVVAMRGDLVSGEGVAEAVRGVDVIAHLASDTGMLATISSARGTKTDVDPTRRLLEAAKREGSPHVVYISIVGIDTIPFAYYRTKLATERVVADCGLPYTTLRTTQWHTLAWDLGERLTKAPVVIAPKGVGMQLLDPGEVATRVVTLIETRPPGRAVDMGGPVVVAMEDILRDYLRANGKHRSVRTIRLPGKMMDALRRGDNLSPDHADGRITWQEWLASHRPG